MLIVDDEASNLALMEELFAVHGARVEGVQEGATALTLARSQRPDLILLDIMMPGMDGYEVCRRLKADEATRRIPVVMITGLGQLDDKIKGLEAGADDFLSKPVNSAELLTRCRSLLRVKELNDELEGAYQRLAGIATFTNTLLRSFDPYQFNVHDNMDRLMDFLLGAGSFEATRPERVILLSATPQGDWTGWAYYRANDQMDHRPLARELSAAGLESVFRGKNLFWVNLEEEPGLGFRRDPLWAHVGEKPPLKNIVGYRSNEVALLATDFGKTVGTYDAQVLSSLAGTIHLFLKTISSQIQEVERAFLYTISALARAAEMHDEDTGMHIARVNAYAALVAETLGCQEGFVQVLGYSAQMHDVGKLHVHPDVLMKKGPLDAREWAEVKLHTVHGARILGDDPRLAMAREVALSHHEHWDGSGYPYGLAREDIPLSGRITMLADVYDALRSPRAYKPPFSHARAVEIITRGDDRLKPGWFDPRVLEAFASLERQFEEIFLSHNS
ncbi:MAG: response regulator [Deltaproteobacteria bacterium]|nr:response regulator [Deltaproteobacteria bacterium]